MTRAQTFGLDALRTTEDEATELFVHHLALAWMFFHNTPHDDGASIREEIERIITLDRGVGFEEGVQSAMKGFAADLAKIYEDDEKERG